MRTFSVSKPQAEADKKAGGVAKDIGFIVGTALALSAIGLGLFSLFIA